MRILELDSPELAAWRKRRAEQGDLVRTPALQGNGFAPGWTASPVVEAETVEPPKAPKPRSGRETQDSVMNFLWSNMTRDRESYERAIRWLRLRVPHTVSHLTDVQLLEHVRKLSDDATRRVLWRKGLTAPLYIDGKR